jgi:hypothetical protein
MRAFLWSTAAAFLATACSRVEVANPGVSDERRFSEERFMASRIEASDCDSVLHGSGMASSLGHATVTAFTRVSVHYPASPHEYWARRLELVSQRGAGSIDLVILPRGFCFIGRGVLRGWSQESLASSYSRFAPTAFQTKDRTLAAN